MLGTGLGCNLQYKKMYSKCEAELRNTGLAVNPELLKGICDFLQQYIHHNAVYDFTQKGVNSH
jgi:hypothetical protein